MTEMRTILVLGIITALLIGAASAMMTTTQTAEAKFNDCTREDSGEICSAGGHGGSDEFSSGGVGRHVECSTTTPTCESSGGSGGNQANGLVGGGGGNTEGCAVSTQVCESQVGGSGKHVKGPGGNSGN